VAILKPGDSGPNVKKLQQTINEIYGASMVDESGDYDDATRDKVADLQKKLNIGRSSGEADPVTLRAFAVALEPKYLVELPKVTAYLTAKELADLQQVTRTVALEALKGVLSLAQKYKVIWQAHSDARGNNAFWSEVIDVVTKASFPDAQTVRKVEAAAKAIESGAKSGTLTDAAFETQSGVIRDAYAELDKYRDETFEGSDKFVDYMEKTASACGEIVDILMTVQTARLSAGGQALGAGVSGTYKAALSEVISASKTSNYSISGGIARAFA
jgi:peptidoglycan hydrolase-like protein with peptidoglycan-binding domain